MSYVKIDQVSKTYEHTPVLKNISLTLEKGELVTLLGQSGCGKSTLLRSIAGLVDVDEGIIAIEGQDVTHVDPRKRQIGMVFQSYALFPNMTVFENVAFGLKMKKETNITPRVKEMLQMVNLSGKEKSFPHELSGGQQQRVALARSLVMKPKVLLLDEPLSALDAKIRKSLQKELKRIQKELNITTVFVTHDQEEAMSMSDTIYIMNEGQIEQSGSPSEIYTTPANSFVAQFIGNYNVIKMKEFHQMVQNSEVNGEEVAIRPEIIELSTVQELTTMHDEHWAMAGTIQDVSMLGNVLRYEVETTNHVTVRVDSLHQSGKTYEVGTRVTMWVPKRECMVFDSLSVAEG